MRFQLYQRDDCHLCDQALAVLFQADRLALATGQFVGRQHPVSIAVHVGEGVAHPRQVLVPGDATVAVGIHAREVVAGAFDLGAGGADAAQRQQPGPARQRHRHTAASMPESCSRAFPVLHHGASA